MQVSKRPVAVAYRRVLTDKPGLSGLGLADQDRAIRELCDRRGLSLEAEFTEIESGKNNSRPQLAKALAVVSRRRGILVVATLSRIGRRVSFVASLMEQGVSFVCADAPDDEPFILHVKASFAEEEARKISSRTKAALAIAKARGTRLGNPQNLSLDDRRAGAARNKAVAALRYDAIRPQISLLKNEGLSIRAIADHISVSPSTVQRVLASESR